MPLVSGTDTYADLDFADDYVDGRLHAQSTVWDTLTDTQKESALSLAMVHMDYIYTYKGQITEDDQGVNWPRKNVRDDQGRTIDDETIPTAIKKAQVELALMWAENDQMTPPAEFFTKDDPATTINQVQMEKLGDLQKQYFKNDDMMWRLQQGYLQEKVYPMLNMILKPYVSVMPGDIFAEVQLY